VKDEQGKPLDVSEIVVRYWKTLPKMTANPTGHRINLLLSLSGPALVIQRFSLERRNT